MQNIIELKDVTVIVENGRTILDHLSLKINEGDFISVIGGNGAGKSTLFNVITGTIAVTSGEVYIFGQKMTKKTPEQRAKYIARVFQDPKMGTAPRMTVSENLAVAALRGQKRSLQMRNLKKDQTLFLEKAKEIGNGLENHLETAAGDLSGGQRQALSLLMATLKKPELLLLDEHTAALDPKTSQAIMKLTDKIVNEGKLTAMMITHQMEDAFHFGNRLLVMKNGKMIRDLDSVAKAKMKIEDFYRIFE